MSRGVPAIWQPLIGRHLLTQCNGGCVCVPTPALSVTQREGGLLPAEEVRQTLAKRGIPLTDSYWHTLCQQCCARSATAAAARPGADMVYARLLNRFIQESDPQKQEGALTSVSDKWCGCQPCLGTCLGMCGPSPTVNPRRWSWLCLR
jgi:hypothetical protein